MDYNKIVVVGRLGRDPEVKTVGSKTLTNFSVATSWKSGEVEHTDWHNITAWEKLGEIAAKLLHKGDRVLVEGRLNYNTVGEGETKRVFAQITASNLINLTAKPAGASDSAAGSNSKAKATGVGTGPELSDEDIPF